MSSQIFLSPNWMPFTLLAIPGLLFLIWSEKRRTVKRMLLGRSARTWIKTSIFLVLAVIVLLILSIARPFWGYQDIEIRAQGKDILVIVDISNSMLAKDISPSRMEFAKRKLRDLVNYVSGHTPGDRIGLILFAGDSYLYCPLTSDYSILPLFIGSISPGLITNQGSSIGDALRGALDTLRNAKARNAVLLLLSDGEDSGVGLSESARLLVEADVSLNAIGIGKPDGSPVELDNGRFLRDARGNIVISKLNEETLKAAAGEGRGKYLRATIDESDLKLIFDQSTVQIPNLGAKKTQKSVRVYNELGPFILGLILGVVLIEALLAKRRIVLGLLLLCAFCGKSFAEPAKQPSISKHGSYLAFQNGEYQKALKGFTENLLLSPQDSKLLQALASTHYKLQDYTEAAEIFRQLAASAKNGREKFEALYNLGNSNFMLNDYKEAIENFEAALSIKQNDSKALHNLELSKIKLQEKLQQQEEQKKNEDNQQEKEQQEQNKEKQQDKKDGDQSSQQGAQDSEGSQSNSAASSRENGSDSNSSGASESQSESATNSADSGENESPQSGASSSSANGENSSSDGGQTASDPAGSKGDQAASSSASAGSDTAGDERDKDTKNLAQQKEVSAGQEVKSHDSASLKKDEARAWLNSLSESPVLLQKKTGKAPKRGSQSW